MSNLNTLISSFFRVNIGAFVSTTTTYSCGYWTSQLKHAAGIFSSTVCILLLATNTASSAPGVDGEWSPLIPWTPHIPSSIANLPDGRILSWNSLAPDEATGLGFEAGFTLAAIYDPSSGGFQVVNSDIHGMFCPGISLTEDGSVIVSGGVPDTNEASLFDIENSSWNELPNMNRVRYYPTALTLPNNQVFLSHARGAGNTSEVYDQATNTWSLTPQSTQQTLINELNLIDQTRNPASIASGYQWYAQLSVAPNGKVLHSGPTPTWHFFDPVGGANNTFLGKPIGERARIYGNVINYDVGKAMLVGGHDPRQAVAVSANNAYLVDMNGAGPVVTQAPPMSFARTYSNSVVMPNGEVMVIGGETSGQNYRTIGARLTPEIYNPATNTWRNGPNMSVPRVYHSTALLMKDARVLSAGGGVCGNRCINPDANQQNGQIYSPSYLFNADNSLAERPEISLAPFQTVAGSRISISASEGIQKFNVVRLSGTTHHINTDQRFLPLALVSSSGNSYEVDLPANPNVLLPGNYWIFAINAAGTPSVGRTIKIIRELDPNEGIDSDGDGVGDNADAFPNDPEEVADADGDGVGDNGDAFPNDPAETVDSDGDGVGDNGDDFPNDPTETVDSDGDGVGDNADAFPNDPTRTDSPITDILIQNSDFEAQGLANGAFTRNLIAQWVSTGTQNGVWNPARNHLGATTPTVAYIDFGGTISQTLQSTLQSGADYALSFKVGGGGFDPNGVSSWAARLLAGNTVLGSVGNSQFNPPGNPLINASLTLTAGELHSFSAQHGELLKIELFYSGLSTPTYFDDISLLRTSIVEVDSDGDGVFDHIDAFPNDPTETVDTDGDSAGDNGDAFPNDATETVDSDGDGVGDNGDAFPNDPTETVDSDGDSVGDNGDDFPNDPTETIDSDGDGVGDNADAFPNDPTRSDPPITDILILNSDFEAQGLANGAFTRNLIAQWVSTGTQNGVWNPARNHLGATTPTVAYIDFGGTISQTLQSTLQSGADYALSFKVGGGGFDPNGVSSWAARLLAGNTVLGSVGNSQFNPPGNPLINASLTLTADELQSFSAQYGEVLKIELFYSGNSSPTYFDDFSLLRTTVVQVDSDGDGVFDNFDAFPNDPTETLDTDGDGVGDNGDAFPADPTETLDSDGDGVGDNSDAFPNDPTETLDTDGDGIGDNGDAFPTDPTETVDSDGDGVGDNSDSFPNDPTETLDTDGDGIGDNGDAFPTDPTETVDSDGDGVGDNSDAFPNDPSETIDSDGDGVGDNADDFPNDPTQTTDIDTDGDGVSDSQDAFPNDPTETADTDSDGVGDNADAFPNDPSETIDTDGDGAGNNGDAFPNDPTEALDSDGDGLGDNADAFPNDPTETVDTDGDGVGDNSDTFPNDPTETVDSDGDGVGDNTDTFPNDPTETVDADGDGVGDNGDAFPNDSTETVDSDGDGIGDNADAFPNNPTETIDSDGDGVGDNGDAFPNDPAETVDSDGDGVGDNTDTFPNDPTESIDTDGDGVGDNGDAFPNDPTETVDSDGDGVGDNGDDFPNDPTETVDSDGDGVGDNADAFPNDPTRTDSPITDILIQNSDFEAQGLANGAFTRNLIAQWVSTGTQNGVWNPARNHLGATTPTVAYIDFGGTISQTLQSTLQSGADYALSFKVGGGGFDPNGVSSWAARLLAGNTVLGSVGNSQFNPPGNPLINASLTLTAGELHSFSAQHGELLKIELFYSGLSTPTYFDDISLLRTSIVEVDSDGDGVFDHIDAFPNDPTETVDTDGDSAGDNGDAFPNDATETVDSDGDGVGDNADAFPDDPTRSDPPITDILILNSDFEAQGLANGAFTRNLIAQWVSTGTRNGVWNPARNHLGATTPTVAYIDFGGTISQTLQSTLQSGADYALSFKVGGGGFDPNGVSSWAARLLAGNTVLGSVGNSQFNPPGNPLINASLTLTADELQSFSAQYGEALKIELFYSGNSSPTYFDDFSLLRTTVAPVDSDGDGVPDDQDAFPNDSTRGFVTPLPEHPRQSTTMIVESHSDGDRIWNVNPDNNSVSVSSDNGVVISEISVGNNPWSLARSSALGEIYVTNKTDATISVINSITLNVEKTITLTAKSQPHGIVFDSVGSAYYVVLEALAKLEKRDTTTDQLLGELQLGGVPRHLSMTYDDQKIILSNFITPLVPGESTSVLSIDMAAGQVFVIEPNTMTLSNTIELKHDNKPIGESDGPGLPNYLGAAAISFDSTLAYVPGKKDNINSGTLRGNPGMSFDQAVRAHTNIVDLVSETNDSRIALDHDNSSVATGAAFSGDSRYLFVALETSRELVVYDTLQGFSLMRLPTGRAPQSVALSSDGSIAYVHNFMDRSISRFDMSEAISQEIPDQNVLPPINVVTNELLDAEVFSGKQFFYDAADPRLAADKYMSCASCHKEGKHDGRVWDFTQFGEGLRNTPSLLGKGGLNQGLLHWTGNFDELQDFEGQIRDFAGGSGLMSDADFNSGSRSQPLGDSKAGVSSDLDALAAYLSSLDIAEPSPYRPASGLSLEAQLGEQHFDTLNCGTCHAGSEFTDSSTGARHNIGTVTLNSGNRLDGPIDGFDTPSLLGAWAGAPYLHDGSASTLAEAIRAHTSVTATDPEIDQLVEYIKQLP